jgi:threonine synthase
VTFLQSLECARCGLTHEAQRPQNLCRACQSPLLARYDLKGVCEELTPGMLQRRSWNMWRYRELLPLEESPITLGESVTPIMPLARLGDHWGLKTLFVKDEGLLPTGTFKARGAAMGISRAAELDIKKVALPTAGNAGGAWAAYGARAGMEVLVAMPRDAPALNVKEVQAAGARCILVDGLISEAGRLVAEACRTEGYFDASTLKEPYRIEGKKTMGLEIAEQYEWRPPTVIVYPTGGGVGLIGMWKAFAELAMMGWLEGPVPRLVAVQSSGCAPVVEAFESGREECTPWPNAQTVASGLRIPKPLGDFLILRALRESEGTAVAVEDSVIRATMRQAAETEGFLCCPEGAAALAGAAELRRRGWIGEDDRVLVMNTGSGLKYPELL